MKILIVDDEQVSRKKLHKILSRFGESHVADSGAEAMKAFTEALLAGEHFNLITLDVRMPDMGGPEVLAMIRKVERNNAIPKQDQAKILMVTSHADQATVMACIQAGCDDFLKKPFSMPLVTQKLTQMGLVATAASPVGSNPE